MEQPKNQNKSRKNNNNKKKKNKQNQQQPLDLVIKRGKIKRARRPMQAQKGVPMTFKKKKNKSKAERKAKMEVQLRELGMSIQPPITRGGTFQLTPNDAAVKYFILDLLEHLSMKTNIFLRTVNADQNIYPGEMALYLYICFLLHIKRVGSLTGSQVGQLPVGDNFIVPVAFGKWLQGFGPYNENGFSCTSCQDFSTAFIPCVSYPDSTVGGLGGPPFSPLGGTVVNRAVRPMGKSNSLTTTINEWVVGGFAPTGMSLQQFVSSRISNMVLVIQGLKVATMYLKDIPEKAPDGCAYVTANFAVQGFTPNYWQAPFKNYNNDVAFLYIGTRNVTGGGNTYNAPNAFMKPVAFQPASAINIDQNEYFNNVFILCWLYVNKYKAGPIMQTTTYCKLKLRTFLYQDIIVDPTAVTRLMANSYRSVAVTANTLGINPAGDENLQILCCNQVLAMMLFLARYNMSAVNYHYYDPFSGVQQYYVTSNYLSLPLPPMVAAALSDLGPVVADGMMYCPTLVSNNTMTGSPTQINNSPWLVLSDGMTGDPAYQTASPLVRRVFSYELVCNNPTAPGIIFNNQSVSSTIAGNNAQIVTAAGGAVYAINTCMQALVGVHNSLYSRFTSGTNFVKSLVHPHNSICGAHSTMLSTHHIVDNISGDNNNESFYPFIDTNLSYAPTRNNRTLVRSYFNTHVSHSELLRSMTSLWVTTQGNPNVLSKYEFYYQDQYNINDFQYEVAMATFSTDSQFTAAIAKKAAEFSARYKQIGNYDMLKIAMSDCYWNDMFNDAVLALSPILRAGAGMVGNEVCGPLCSIAGVAIYDAIVSLVGVESNEIEKPVKSKKPTFIEPLINGMVSEVKKAKQRMEASFNF